MGTTLTMRGGRAVLMARVVGAIYLLVGLLGVTFIDRPADERRI